MSWPKIEIIDGGAQSPGPLLTRAHLLVTPFFRVYLHVFHRSDADRCLHSHPWPFVSLILRGGYTEVRPIRPVRDTLRGHPADHTQSCETCVKWVRDHQERKRYWPGMILFRPSWWAHRIEVAPGKTSVSLVIVGRKCREWGFFGLGGFIPWRIFTGSAEECG